MPIIFLVQALHVENVINWSSYLSRPVNGPKGGGGEEGAATGSNRSMEAMTSDGNGALDGGCPMSHIDFKKLLCPTSLSL